MKGRKNGKQGRRIVKTGKKRGRPGAPEHWHDYTGKPCNFCKIPITKDDYTGIPAHVVCVARFLSKQKAVIKKADRQTTNKLCISCNTITFTVLKHSAETHCSQCKETTINGL